MTQQPSRQVVTFYSYKGGTGRTMTLANMAWILASNGHKVLMVDWDLEAPGLHRYFHPFLVDPELESSPGIIDMMWDFVDQTMSPAAKAPSGPADGSAKEQQRDSTASEWYRPLADIRRYAVRVEHDFAGPESRDGRIDLAPAGRQGASYPSRVNSFDWRNFYERLRGGAFIDAVRQSMLQHYEYVLVDSRTGVSDTSGICTVQLPDTLVVCFTLNVQSIRGASGVARSVYEHRASRGGSEPDDDRTLRILPVPTRVETGEDQKMRAALAVAEEAFGQFVEAATQETAREYFGAVQLPYKELYAYEEQLSAIRDESFDSLSMLPRLEALTRIVTHGQVSAVVPMAPTRRDAILERYDAVLGPKPASSTEPVDEFDVWRHEIRLDAAKWTTTGKPTSLLLAGPRLAEAEHWNIVRGADLSPSLSEYIAQSIFERTVRRAGSWFRYRFSFLRRDRTFEAVMKTEDSFKEVLSAALPSRYSLSVDTDKVWFLADRSGNDRDAVLVYPDPAIGVATVSAPRSVARSLVESGWLVETDS